MDKDFLVLQCAECSQFCVQQTTKSRKWVCRLCGKKQSIVKVYARSPLAAPMRAVVQRLSMALAHVTSEALVPLPSGTCPSAPIEHDPEVVGTVWESFIEKPDVDCHAMRSIDDGTFTTSIPEGLVRAGAKRQRNQSQPAASDPSNRVSSAELDYTGGIKSRKEVAKTQLAPQRRLLATAVRKEEQAASDHRPGVLTHAHESTLALQQRHSSGLQVEDTATAHSGRATAPVWITSGMPEHASVLATAAAPAAPGPSDWDEFL